MATSAINNITSQLKAAIDHYDTQINNTGFWGGVLDTISYNRDQLQIILNGILEKNGVISDQEQQTAADALRKAKEEELDAQKKAYNRKMVTIGLVTLLVAGGIFVFIRHHKSKK